jgi:hypothetical protein
MIQSDSTSKYLLDILISLVQVKSSQTVKCRTKFGEIVPQRPRRTWPQCKKQLSAFQASTVLLTSLGSAVGPQSKGHFLQTQINSQFWNTPLRLDTRKPTWKCKSENHQARCKPHQKHQRARSLNGRYTPCAPHASSRYQLQIMELISKGHMSVHLYSWNMLKHYNLTYYTHNMRVCMSISSRCL